MTQDTKKQFEKDLIQYGLKHNYIEKTKEGLKFVGSKNQNKKTGAKKWVKNIKYTMKIMN